MADPKIDNRAYYDQFAQNYEDHRHGGYHLLVDDLESALVLDEARGKDVLEVGCGTGLILRRVAEVARSHVGLDLSEGMLAKARARGLNVVQGSATELPFEDGSFDLSYSFKVLSHVPDLKKALREMARVTRPGGRVFAELYNKHSLRYVARRARGGSSIGGGLDDNQVYFRFYSPEAMQAQLPPSLKLVKMHGVRVFTPLPNMVSWPVIGRGLRWAERAAVSSPLARFGGFVVLECECRTA
jgi:ubiquinone/menaquinone biosynthesis C-methylase UbiE